MYEDDNETCGYEKEDCVKTGFLYTEAEDAEFVIRPAQGNLALIPGMRSYTIELHGFEEVKGAELLITVDGQSSETTFFYDKDKHTIIVQLSEISVTKEAKVTIKKELRNLKNDVKERCFRFLNQAEIEFFLKDQIYGLLQKENRLHVLIAALHTLELEEKLLAVLLEILTAKM